MKKESFKVKKLLPFYIQFRKYVTLFYDELVKVDDD